MIILKSLHNNVIFGVHKRNVFYYTPKTYVIVEKKLVHPSLIQPTGKAKK